MNKELIKRLRSPGCTGIEIEAADEIERLCEVLKWYAKADYDRRECNDGDGYFDVWGAEEILEDKGKRAREALK